MTWCSNSTNLNRSLFWSFIYLIDFMQIVSIMRNYVMSPPPPLELGCWCMRMEIIDWQTLTMIQLMFHKIPPSVRCLDGLRGNGWGNFSKIHFLFIFNSFFLLKIPPRSFKSKEDFLDCEWVCGAWKPLQWDSMLSQWSKHHLSLLFWWLGVL